MTKNSSVIIEDIEFVLDLKSIKNLYIRVKKDGKAYVSVPKRLSQAQIQMTLLSHLPWVKAQLAKLSSLPMVVELQYESGETHVLWGRNFILQLATNHSKTKVMVRGDQIIIQSKGDLTLEQKIKALDAFYRFEIQKIMPALMTEWERTIQVQSSEWRLKKMKTRWGTCNTRVKRIWLNIELAKYPLECLEYVLVHELVHLLERSHNHRFKALMTTFLPDWPVRRKLLNSLAMKMC